jgi:hypothetical protein
MLQCITQWYRAEMNIQHKLSSFWVVCQMQARLILLGTTTQDSLTQLSQAITRMESASLPFCREWQKKISITMGAPTWRAKCQSSFATLPPVLLQEQPAVVLLLERALISLAMDERSEHQDLRGSDRRSVTSYVHGRMELYCSSLPCLNPFFFRPFRSGVYPSLL